MCGRVHCSSQRRGCRTTLVVCGGVLGLRLARSTQGRAALHEDPMADQRMPRALALATAWVRLVTPSFP
jgi:hypothetical protein